MTTKRLLTAAAALVAVAFVAWGDATPGVAQTGGSELTPVIISFDRRPAFTDEGLIRNTGGQVRYRYHLVDAIAARVPADAVSVLDRLPGVSVEPDGRVYAHDAELDSSWGVKKISAGVVHDGGNRGAGVRVGVIDSGIDYTHPDLNANYAGGRDFVNGDNDPMDDNNHGTHVAGTLAAEDDNAGVVGVAPNVTLYALKVLDSSGSGAWSDIIAAMEWAADPNGDGSTADHLDVVNLSLGGSQDPGTAVQAAFDNAEAAGVVIVASAGNSGNRWGWGSNVGYPARYGSVIAVAATDKNDSRASFSSTGAEVEIAAPGVGVNSTLPGGGYSGETWNGTSMASPHVAGTAALVIASGITDTSGNGRINDEVRARLQQTALDLGSAGRDSQYGFGRVRADLAAPTPVGPTTPGAPTLTATAGDGVVELSWTTPADGGSAITSYRVYRGTSSGTGTELTTLGNVTSYNDATVANGTEYFYTVAAINGEGEGTASNEAAATPEAPPQPTAPEAPTLTATAGDGVVELSWTAPADGGSAITNYRVYRGTSSGTGTELTTLGNVASYNDATVANGTEYFYTVAAINGVGEGAASNEVAATPEAPPPPPPDGALLASDDFEANGVGWSGGWSLSGDASISTSGGAYEGSRHLRHRGSWGFFGGVSRAERTAPLGGHETIRLRFCVKVDSFEGNDAARVGYQLDGGSVVWPAGLPWAYSPAQSDSAYHCYETADIATSGAGTLTVIFEGQSMARNDYWYIDNVEVRGY